MDKILTLILRHKSILLAFNATILVIALAKLVFSPSKWTAEAQLILHKNTSNLNTHSGALNSLNGRESNQEHPLNSLKTQESILLSNPVLEQVYLNDLEQKSLNRLTKYKKLFDVASVKKSNTLDLYVTASSPKLAENERPRVPAASLMLQDIR